MASELKASSKETTYTLEKQILPTKVNSFVNDNPKRWRSKDGQKNMMLSCNPLNLGISVFILPPLLDPCGGWKWRIKTRAWENKPSCHQVSDHCSPPITTLLHKSLFSLHTVSTWCYHFSLNSIKFPSPLWEKRIVLRWAQFCAGFPYEVASCHKTYSNAVNVECEIVMNKDHY